MYIDILILVNFIYDFLILRSVKVILRRNIKTRNIIISSLFGELTLLSLFFDISSILLKIVLGIFLVFICFGFKNFKYFINNLLYFYMNSILLGGTLYFLKLNILSDFNNELAINVIILFFFGPIIIYLYVKRIMKLKNFYSYFYKVEIYNKGSKINLNGYLDTGNSVKDPYKNRNILVVNKEKLRSINNNFLLVPINTVNGKSLMKCFKADNVYIKGIGFKNNLLIGISESKIKIEGIDCLISKNILEET